MAEEPTFLTAEGKAKYEKKLKYLKGPRREQLAERIRTAREFGDISENAEYESAKAEQAFVEGEISDLEKLLKRAQVINKSDIRTDEVGLGTSVTIQNMLEGEENEIITFEIVGTRETKPQNGRISNISPLGLALIGHGKYEIVDVRTPGGLATWKILDIHTTVE